MPSLVPSRNIGGRVDPSFLSGPLPAVMGRILQAKNKVKNSILFIAKGFCSFINYF